MMPLNNPTSSPNPASRATPAQAETSANLLFALFIFVADAEESLTAREVQCLHEMIDHPIWVEDELIAAGLENLRARYGELWKEYQKKAIARSPSGLAEKLDALLAATPYPASVLAGLRTFVDRLCANSSPPLVRLGLATLSPARKEARREAEALLESAQGSPGKAAARSAEKSPVADAAPAAAAPVHANSADLSIWPAATTALSPENLWKRGRTPVRCIAVIPETHDVKTFVFQTLQHAIFAYKPGQFVTLELPIDGKTVRRSYTISSSPSRPFAISITTKRVPGGLVSNWLHDHMQVGFQFALSGPHGEFTCFDAPAEKLLLIAAGSGITPVMSMLRWLVDTASSADVVFLNNIRTPVDIIFENELKYLAMRCGEKLKMGLIPGRVEAGQAWNGPVCHFSEQLVRLWAPDFAEREVFVCGPPGYMDVVRATLERIGHPTARYHQESFGGHTPVVQPGGAASQAGPGTASPTPRSASPAPANPAPNSALPAAASDRQVEIVFANSGKTVTATSGDFILDIAEEHDIKLESSCRAGNCGTCKVKISAGKVEMEDQQALSEGDLNDGYVLLCVGRACSERVVLAA